MQNKQTEGKGPKRRHKKLIPICSTQGSHKNNKIKAIAYPEKTYKVKKMLEKYINKINIKIK